MKPMTNHKQSNDYSLII